MIKQQNKVFDFEVFQDKENIVVNKNKNCENEFQIFCDNNIKKPFNRK